MVRSRTKVKKHIRRKPGRFRLPTNPPAADGQTGQTALSKLLCGDTPSHESGITEVLRHLSNSIDNIVRSIVQMDYSDAAKLALMAPFFARSILELGSTAILARLDPFRLLVLRESQKQPDYKIDKAHKSSIRWQGDVLAEKVVNLWEDKALQNPTRALLGAYFMELVWSPHFELMLDSVENISGDEWILELRRKDSKRFCSELLSDFTSVYSELSKGIHHEFVIPMTASFDESTVRELMRKVVFNVSTLGLVLSVVDYAANPLSVGNAAAAYNQIQKMRLF